MQLQERTHRTTVVAWLLQGAESSSLVSGSCVRGLFRVSLAALPDICVHLRSLGPVVWSQEMPELFPEVMWGMEEAGWLFPAPLCGRPFSNSADCFSFQIAGLRFISSNFISSSFICTESLGPMLLLSLARLPCSHRHISRDKASFS